MGTTNNAVLPQRPIILLWRVWGNHWQCDRLIHSMEIVSL